MEISVIGSGHIGRSIGSRLEASGHTVTYGSRHPGGGTVAIADAIDASSAVVVAIPGDAVEGFVADNASGLAGKLVIDATNRMGGPVANSADLYRAAAPTARYARAFNSLGWENFADPQYDDGPADLFFAAAPDDRSVVEDVISGVGLRPVYAGEDPTVVDAVGRLWMTLAMGQGRGRAIAFRLLER